jgi:hypothetical protein
MSTYMYSGEYGGEKVPVLSSARAVTALERAREGFTLMGVTSAPRPHGFQG